jgi:hypothetical protein
MLNVYKYHTNPDELSQSEVHIRAFKLVGDMNAVFAQHYAQILAEKDADKYNPTSLSYPATYVDDLSYIKFSVGMTFNHRHVCIAVIKIPRYDDAFDIRDATATIFDTNAKTIEPSEEVTMESFISNVLKVMRA